MDIPWQWCTYKGLGPIFKQYLVDLFTAHEYSKWPWSHNLSLGDATTMGKPLGLENVISADQLETTFPFIRHDVRGRVKECDSLRTSAEPSSDLVATLKIPHRPFPTELFDQLTKQEMQGVFEILHYTMEASTGADIHQLLQLIQRVVASPRVIGGVAQLDSKGGFHEFNSVINVSYSNDWLYKYGTNGYASVDPILQTILTTFRTQVWEQSYKKTYSSKQLEFTEEARSYGLTNGLTTGMSEPGRNFASFFSFAGGDQGNTVRYKNLLEYLLPYLHRILMVNVHTPASNRIKGLSPRELVVLQWMKQGKTNWEISRIIGVSERTVRFHVEGIFMKLDVGSRTQAVAYAIEQGLFPNT